jgi:predicted nuclease of predicted toxin-antitoxin system
VRFVADESVDKQIVDGLRAGGHSVLFIAESEPSVSDEIVLARSREQDAVLVTADKDFGELVFRRKLLTWWARGDSNARPLPCQGSALTN